MKKIFRKLTKKTILAILAIIVIGIPLLYLTILNQKTAAAWFSEQWLYRTPLTITHNAEVLNNKVKFDIDTAALITAGKMQSDCGDSRFTDANGKLLKYYLDSSGGACNTNSTDYYVLIPKVLNGTTTIYHYYGNPSAPDGTQSVQFSEDTLTPSTGISAGTEGQGPGPVLYWKFDDGQGTNAQDSSSSNIDGTLNNTPAWQPEDRCIAGKCLYFDGTNNENVSLTDNSKLDFGATGNFTVSAWVKRNGASSAINYIISKHDVTDDTEDGGYKLYTDASGDLCFGIDDDITWGPDISACTSAVDFDDNKWHYAAGVRDQTGTDKIYLYVDGNQRASTADSTTATLANSNTFYVGVDRDGTSNEWKGFIDEVKIYPYARSAAQIKTDFAQGTSGSSSNQGTSANLGSKPQEYLSEGLVGYWKMDESSWTGSAGEVKDASGNGLNGTATGTPPTTATAKFGPGGSFNGSTDYVSVTDTTGSPLDFTTDYTISVWVKLDTLPSTGAAGLVNKFALGSGGYEITISSTGLINIWQGNGGVVTASNGSTVLTAGNWYHIVFAASPAGKRRLYVNNAEDPNVSGTFTLGANNTSLSIGSGDAVFGNKKIDGLIDEVRFYNRALSSKEISDLYNWAPGPVGYWDFEEGTGTAVNDKSTGANTGTWNGTGATHWSAGKYGKGGGFNGTDDYVSVANTLTGVQSVSFWIKPSANAANMLDLDGGTHYITSDSNGTITATGFSSPIIYVNGISGGTLSANVWNYVSVTTATAFDSTSSFTIGEANGSFSGGIIDDVRIYNYARTQKQIVSDMNAGHPAVGSPVGSAVAHWKMDEGYGTSANDSTPNANTLTLSSASWTNAGKFGKAWNGTNAVWLSKTDDSDFDVTATDDYAISLWFKSDSADNPGAVEYLFNKANATTAGYAVYANTDGTVCFGIDDDTTWGPDISSCSPTDIYDNTWHYLVAVRDTVADKILIYTDGVLRDSDTDSTTATLANSLSLYLGDRDGTNNGDEFTGDLDEVKVYRYALNSDDVKVEYNRGSSMVLGTLSDNSSYAAGAANQEYCVPGDTTSCAAPVGRWDFEEKVIGDNKTLYNTSGSNNGTTHWGANVAGMNCNVPGKYGSACSFDGTDDYISLGSNIVLAGSGSSISFWFKANAFVGLFAGNSGDNDTYIYPASATSISIQTNTNLTVKNFTVPTMSTGTWYFLTVTRSSNTTRVFLNGVESSSGGQTQTPDLTINQFGKYADGSMGVWYNGLMDDIKIYSYARTPAQIAYDYNRGKPVGHWKLDECQGTTAYDSSGNNNSGTIYPQTLGQTSVGTCTTNANTMWYNGATGKRNASLNFDGTDDYMSISDNSILDMGTSNWSVSAWVKTASVSSNAIIDKRQVTGGTWKGWALYGDANSKARIQFDYQSGGSAIESVSMTSLNSGSWIHLVAIFDRTGSQKLYVNGKLEDSDDISNYSALDQSTTSDLKIGVKAPSESGLGNFNGQIDDVKVWNYALTAAQVKNEYNGGAVNFGPATGSP